MGLDLHKYPGFQPASQKNHLNIAPPRRFSDYNLLVYPLPKLGDVGDYPDQPVGAGQLVQGVDCRVETVGIQCTEPLVNEHGVD